MTSQSPETPEAGTRRAPGPDGYSPLPGGDALQAEHIAKRFGAVTALVDVNLRLARARCSACSATTARASRR